MEKWDYKLPTPESFWGNQKDWNQTLLTKFNILSVGNAEVLIKVPNNLKSLIETLMFYDESTNKIGDRFNVEFIESDSNIIYVADSPLEIENINHKYEDKTKKFEVKLESIDPTGFVTKSQELSMVIVDDDESMINNDRLFIHIGECLYRIDKTGVIIERIVPHESN